MFHSYNSTKEIEIGQLSGETVLNLLVENIRVFRQRVGVSRAYESCERRLEEVLTVLFASTKRAEW